MNNTPQPRAERAARPRTVYYSILRTICQICRSNAPCGLHERRKQRAAVLIDRIVKLGMPLHGVHEAGVFYIRALDKPVL